MRAGERHDGRLHAGAWERGRTFAGRKATIDLRRGVGAKADFRRAKGDDRSARGAWEPRRTFAERKGTIDLPRGRGSQGATFAERKATIGSCVGAT